MQPEQREGSQSNHLRLPEVQIIEELGFGFQNLFQSEKDPAMLSVASRPASSSLAARALHRGLNTSGFD